MQPVTTTKCLLPFPDPTTNLHAALPNLPNDTTTHVQTTIDVEGKDAANPMNVINFAGRTILASIAKCSAATANTPTSPQKVAIGIRS